MMVKRRRATPEELAEGERQMKAAQERLTREAQDPAVQDQVDSGDRQRAEDVRSEFLVPLEGALAEVENRLVTTPNPPGLNAEERPVVSGPVSGERATATLEVRQNETEVRQDPRIPGRPAEVPNGGQVQGEPRTPLTASAAAREDHAVFTGQSGERDPMSTPLFNESQLR